MTTVAIASFSPLPQQARERLLAAISKAEMPAARPRKIRLAASAAPTSHPPRDNSSGDFSALMLPHLDAAYSFARYLTRGDSAAEDLVHDAYMRALQAFPNFRGGDAKAWILAIIRNCFLTWAKGRDLGKTIADEEVLNAVADERTPENDLVRAQQAQTMRRLIEALPPHLAEIIVLREIEELSYRDIALAIDAPIGTVMSRLARAREQLAAAWRAESGTAS
jgi:RNA polymerase sigma-70 factor (ECF subfamily)